jgi:hypothetical protein
LLNSKYSNVCRIGFSYEEILDFDRSEIVCNLVKDMVLLFLDRKVPILKYDDCLGQKLYPIEDLHYMHVYRQSIMSKM